MFNSNLSQALCIKVKYFMAVLAVFIMLPSFTFAETEEPIWKKFQVTRFNPAAVERVNPFVYMSTGIGYVYLIKTAGGNVVVDTGLAPQGQRQQQLLLKASESAPYDTRYIIVTHAHPDHNGGVFAWRTEQSQVVAHERYSEFQKVLKDLNHYFHHRNHKLYPFIPEKPVPLTKPDSSGTVIPDLTVNEQQPLKFRLGGISFEVIATPNAEGYDGISLWLPDHGIFFAGDLFGPIFPMWPNLTTLRGEPFRRTAPYLETLDRLLELDIRLLLTGHDEPHRDPKEIRAGIKRIRDALQYVIDETVEGMNEGKDVYTLMNEIKLPPHLALTEEHGKVSWSVRGIWHSFADWFMFDSTQELYGSPPQSMYKEFAKLAGGSKPLVRRAAQFNKQGYPLKALHFTDIALASNPDNRRALQQRIIALRKLFEDAKKNPTDVELVWLESEINATKAKLPTTK